MAYADVEIANVGQQLAINTRTEFSPIDMGPNEY